MTARVSHAIKIFAISLAVLLAITVYVLPRYLWPAADAERALWETGFFSGVQIGRQRGPCNAGAKYIFGYRFEYGLESGGGQGAVCWDIRGKRWVWRTDHPHLEINKP